MNFINFIEFIKCTESRTTPFDQYYMGADFFKKSIKVVELALNLTRALKSLIKKVRTTPFSQYSTEGRPFL